MRMVDKRSIPTRTCLWLQLVVVVVLFFHRPTHKDNIMKDNNVLIYSKLVHTSLFQ
jgi:hypothetical protein